MTDAFIPPTTPDALFALFDRLGLAHTTAHHPPVFTVEEAVALRGTLPGLHAKNLFLVDKKERHALVVVREDTPVDLKALAAAIGLGRPSFGSPDRLRRMLGVEPGSVTPFALVNDTAGAVSLVLDKALTVADPVNFHPLVNTMTTALSRDALMRFFAHTGHAPHILDIAGLGAAV